MHFEKRLDPLPKCLVSGADLIQVLGARRLAWDFPRDVTYPFFVRLVAGHQEMAPARRCGEFGFDLLCEIQRPIPQRIPGKILRTAFRVAAGHFQLQP